MVFTGLKPWQKTSLTGLTGLTEQLKLRTSQSKPNLCRPESVVARHHKRRWNTFCVTVTEGDVAYVL